MNISRVESQLTSLDLHHYKDAHRLRGHRRAVHPARPAAVCLAGVQHQHDLPPSASVAATGEPRGNVERSEEHTSELQSRGHLVCRLLLEKKNKNTYSHFITILQI